MKKSVFVVIGFIALLVGGLVYAAPKENNKTNQLEQKLKDMNKGKGKNYNVQLEYEKFLENEVKRLQKQEMRTTLRSIKSHLDTTYKNADVTELNRIYGCVNP